MASRAPADPASEPGDRARPHAGRHLGRPGVRNLQSGGTVLLCAGLMGLAATFAVLFIITLRSLALLGTEPAVSG